MRRLVVLASREIFPAPKFIIPPQASLQLTGATPVWQMSVQEFPDAGSLVLTGSIPTVVANTNSFQPNSTSLALASSTPVLTSGTGFLPSAASLTVTGVIPTIAIGPWSPSQMSAPQLAAWYDFSDAGTITAVAGSVSAVTDKGSHGNNLANAFANKPTTSTGINSLGTITFATQSNASRALQNTSVSTFDGNVAGVCIAGVWLLTTGQSTLPTPIDVEPNTSGTGNTAYIKYSSSTQIQAATNGQGGTFTLSDANPHVFSSFIDTVSRNIYVDGTAGTISSVSRSTFTSGALRIGGDFGVANNAFQGIIGEVIIWNDNGTDTTTRQKIEGYLAWKWGLVANLPGGHPYKSAPP